MNAEAMVRGMILIRHLRVSLKPGGMLKTKTERNLADQDWLAECGDEKVSYYRNGQV